MSAALSYPSLFSPLRIGNRTVRNRIMQTAHAKMFSEHGLETRRNLDYQVERAKGGIGLIVTGNRQIHPSSASRRFPVAYLREAIEGDREMTAAVHEHGAVIFAQLNHFGVNSLPTTEDPRAMWGPSGVKSLAYRETTKEMEVDDIAELTEWWARSAEIAREGGFDGVEVHLSHQYLLHEFLSPLFNHRDDQYGGSLENRMRFPLQVIEAVRDRVGADFVVGVRTSLSDAVPGGLDVGDAVEIGRRLEATGLIDYIGTTGGGSYDFSMIASTTDMPDGHLVESVRELKAAVSELPVFAVGGIVDPVHAEHVIAGGAADMVALTRGQIADPNWANKVREGRERDIYRCIRGNQGCIRHVVKGIPIGCTVNPEAGREGRFGGGTLEPADPAGHWLVVGGGPAGLKAAETLARRGHRVTLCEAADRLGGQVNLILGTPHRKPVGRLVEDLEHHLRQLEVEVRLGTRVTAELVAEIGADGAIVATGAVPSADGHTAFLPTVERIPGVEGENVLTGFEAIADPAKVGRSVVVLDDDGARYGSGVVELLLAEGRRVELLTPYNAPFPASAETADMPRVYSRVFGNPAFSYEAGAWLSGIEPGRVTALSLFGGGERTIDGVDTVVLATSPRADDSLYKELKAAGVNVHRVGDCVAPRELDHAVFEGYVAGRELFEAEDSYTLEGALESGTPVTVRAA